MTRVSRVLAVVVTPTFPIGLVGCCSVFFFPLLREYGATAVRQYATQVQVQVQTIPTHSHTRERSVCFPRGVDSTDLLEYRATARAFRDDREG